MAKVANKDNEIVDAVRKLLAETEELRSQRDNLQSLMDKAPFKDGEIDLKTHDKETRLVLLKEMIIVGIVYSVIIGLMYFFMVS